MHYKVEIETRPDGNPALAYWGLATSKVVRGPSWVRRLDDWGSDASYAFGLLCWQIRNEYPQHSFDFIHTPA